MRKCAKGPHRRPLTFDFGGVWEPLPPLSRLSFGAWIHLGWGALLGGVLGRVLYRVHGAAALGQCTTVYHPVPIG